MGTQFASRLTTADTRAVLAGIRHALKTGVQREGRKSVAFEKLPAATQRELGDATMAQVMLVAERHKFSEAFRESSLFISVLDWLMRLRSDAAFNGFQQTIATMELADAPYAVPILKNELRAITDADEHSSDPFRISISIAARGVLGEGAIRSARQDRKLSPAEQFGRGLASLNLKALVEHYVGTFFADFLDRLMSRADPSHADASVKAGRSLAEKSARRLTRKAVNQIGTLGALTDVQRIRAVVFDELSQFLEAHGP